MNTLRLGWMREIITNSEIASLGGDIDSLSVWFGLVNFLFPLSSIISLYSLFPLCMHCIIFVSILYCMYEAMHIPFYD